MRELARDDEAPDRRNHAPGAYWELRHKGTSKEMHCSSLLPSDTASAPPAAGPGWEPLEVLGSQLPGKVNEGGNESGGGANSNNQPKRAKALCTRGSVKKAGR